MLAKLFNLWHARVIYIGVVKVYKTLMSEKNAYKVKIIVAYDCERCITGDKRKEGAKKINVDDKERLHQPTPL
jgi:hypothetical protein